LLHVFPTASSSSSSSSSSSQSGPKAYASDALQPYCATLSPPPQCWMFPVPLPGVSTSTRLVGKNCP
jgi:hypothetical protein